MTNANKCDTNNLFKHQELNMFLYSQLICNSGTNKIIIYFVIFSTYSSRRGYHIQPAFGPGFCDADDV